MAVLGVPGLFIPQATRYAQDLNLAGTVRNFPPCWIGGHAYVESIVLEINGTIPSAEKTKSLNGDGGFGLLQLTERPEGYAGDWPPDGWDDARANAIFAIDWYLKPAMTFWNQTYGFVGMTLVRCVAAEFNCGRTKAIAGHDVGNVDLNTENGDYAARVVAAVQSLLTTGDYPK